MHIQSNRDWLWQGMVLVLLRPVPGQHIRIGQPPAEDVQRAAHRDIHPPAPRLSHPVQILLRAHTLAFAPHHPAFDPTATAYPLCWHVVKSLLYPMNEGVSVATLLISTWMASMLEVADSWGNSISRCQ